MGMQLEPFYTLSEAARILRCSVRKLQYEMQANALTYVLMGRSVRFRESDLLDYVERNLVKRREK